MATYTVLVADDSETVHRIVEMACEGSDVDVIAVTDGDEAIARISDRPPSVILADIGMPGRNGYDVAAFVQAQPQLQHIPVVLIAGMFEPADEERARRLGCVEVLVKPLKPQYVSERLRHWLDTAPAVPTAPTPTTDAASVEAYFSRLDAAFKSLQRPAVSDVVAPVSVASADAPIGHVPTLQELLSRLPEESRSRLTPIKEERTQDGQDTSLLDAIADRVLDRLSKRDDLLDEIARRVARRSHGGDGH